MSHSEWKPNKIEQKAVAQALFKLGFFRRDYWHDDLMQSALMELWTTADKRDRENYVEAYGVAYRGALDEFRRVTFSRRLNQVEFVSIETLDERSEVFEAPDESTPEKILAAKQAVEILLRMPESHKKALTAVLESDTRRAAAAQLKVDPSMINRYLDKTNHPERRLSVRERLDAAI